MAFPTTRWTLLAGATLHGDSQAVAALGDFYDRYRGPVRQFFRLRGVEQDEVEDMVQAFFLHAMERSLLRRADRLQGSFRSWLCGAAVFFLRHHRERMGRLKRGGGEVPLSLEGTEGLEGAMVGSVDDVREFDRAWAVRMLELAMERVEGEYGDAERFALLREFLPGAVRQPGAAEAARRSGLKEGTLRVEVHRLRARFRECLRAEVALTTSAPHEVDEEIAWLREVLGVVR